VTPLERYQADLAGPDFLSDPVQQAAVDLTERLYRRLCRRRERREGLWSRLLGGAKPAVPRGLYFWGGVGRGKTYVVDAFYDALPFAEKRRVHFHRFMRDVHRQRQALGDIENPMNELAKALSEEVRVLCLDEFHVSDITDAMLLARLLEPLFQRGIVMVATSNEALDRLYWDGLQREQFLPAIALLEEHMDIYCFDGDIDYRLRALERAEIYHQPLDAAAGQALAYAFEQIAPERGQAGVDIEIEDRLIPTVRLADGVAWFEFDVICGDRRSAPDYIEIARLFQTVLVANIPHLDDEARDAVRRFIHLVDELYDRNVKMIVSAAGEPETLYCGNKLRDPFKRTVSRLQEMQTHSYLGRPHLSDLLIKQKVIVTT
jgi:cell division protein ZapE